MVSLGWFSSEGPGSGARPRPWRRFPPHRSFAMPWKSPYLSCYLCGAGVSQPIKLLANKYTIILMRTQGKRSPSFVAGCDGGLWNFAGHCARALRKCHLDQNLERQAATCNYKLHLNRSLSISTLLPENTHRVSQTIFGHLNRYIRMNRRTERQTWRSVENESLMLTDRLYS